MRTKFFSTIVLMSLLLVLFSSISYAGKPPTSEKSQGEARQADVATRQQQFDALAKQTEKNGEVRVIVGLVLPNGFQQESLLPDGRSVNNQRAAIRSTQATLGKQLGRNAEVYVNYETMPFMAMKVNANALEALSKSPLVNFIQEDRLSAPSLASSTAKIGMSSVWSGGNEGAGQAVVIVDTGVDYDHPFLGGRVVAEACFSNAGNEGISLCGSSSHPADAQSSACNGGSLCTHGTHVAGIAAGNGSSYDGVARGADIIGIQVFTRFEDPICSQVGTSAPCVLSYSSDQLSALEYVNNTLASQHSIASVNMSLGGGGPYTSNCDSAEAATKSVIDSLWNKGIATVIASGNESFTNGVASPACISSAVTVGSTTDTDSVSSFSNMGSLVDLMAPGSNIDSSVPGGGYDNYNGTSMATPHVAGAFAVLKAAAPSASIGDILNALASTGTNVSRNGHTKPRINVDDALAELQPTSGSCPAGYTAYSGSLSGTGQKSYQPNGNYYYSSTSGAHKAILTGPSNADFDLFLQKWSNGWQTVSKSESGSSNESITYNGSKGYYVWQVYSYSGSGSYDICLQTP